MKKKITYLLIFLLPLIANAEINGNGLLQVSGNSSIDVRNVFEGNKAKATIKMTHYGDEYEKYLFAIVTAPVLSNSTTPTLSANPNSFYCDMNAHYDDWGNQIVFGQGEEISVECEVTIPEYENKKELTWWIRFENPDDNSDYVDFFLNFHYHESYWNTGTSIGGDSKLIVNSLNDIWYYEVDRYELDLGVSNEVSAAVFGDDNSGFPATINTPWHWEIVLFSNEGNYTYKTGQTTGETGTSWNFTINSNLPNRDWVRDNNGLAQGFVRVYVSQDGYFIEASWSIAVKNAPNKPTLSASLSQTNVAELRYKATGASKYNIRYKEVGNSSWSYIYNSTSSSRLISLQSGQYQVQVQAKNNYGVGYWSSNYYIYSTYQIPNSLTSSNINLPNIWNLQSTDGADRTFKIFIPSGMKLDISTNYPETNFKNKIEIFSANGISTGYYDCARTPIIENPHNPSKHSSALISVPSEDRKARLLDVQLEEGYYFIVVDGINGQQGNFKLTVNENILTVPFTTIGSTVGNSNNWDVNGADGADAAIKFNLPTNSNISVTTCFSTTNYDTKIEVFDINGNRTGLYNDDASCSYNNRASSKYDFYLDAGIYYLVIDGYNTSTGNFKVNVTANNLKNGSNPQNNTFELISNEGDLGKYEIFGNLNVYPNPVSSMLTVSNSKSLPINYELINVMGCKLKSGIINNGLDNININDLPSGLYVLKLECQSSIRSEKIKIQH
ncbi:MAG: T9SS type A sorting domain-containing protein [Salinivirgaceae bacterium]|nr:T9SS type A sorting domain-containing protein [Salinivirgaceae bacterium]